MPLPSRGARALLLLAAFMLLAAAPALPVLADAPGGGKPQQPVRFVLEPRLAGVTIASCAGQSPLRNDCAVDFDADACFQYGCYPAISGTMGYTGSVTSAITGIDAATNRPAAVWRTCSFAAGMTARVLVASLGDCGEHTFGSSAQRLCPDGPGSCGYYLRPPLVLEGHARAGMVPSPLGPWTATVES